MLLIADSGSTKCDWVLVRDGKNSYFSTIGFNPFYHSTEFIHTEINKNKALAAHATTVSKIVFYGAGCHNKKLGTIVSKALRLTFPHAEVTVDHDMIGSAHATCGTDAGIACILGTGSNSCYFDGTTIYEEVPALAYILGDEGSGSYYGKRLLADFLYKRLPTVLFETLKNDYELDKDVILQNTYFEKNANVYLASFAKVLHQHKNEKYVQELVALGMYAFLDVHVKCYKNYQEVPVHFVGSIAFHFQDILKEQCNKLGIQLGNIVQKPIDNLALYHSN